VAGRHCRNREAVIFKRVDNQKKSTIPQHSQHSTSGIICMGCKAEKRKSGALIDELEDRLSRDGR